MHCFRSSIKILFSFRKDDWKCDVYIFHPSFYWIPVVLFWNLSWQKFLCTNNIWWIWWTFSVCYLDNSIHNMVCNCICDCNWPRSNKKKWLLKEYIQVHKYPRRTDDIFGVYVMCILLHNVLDVLFHLPSSVLWFGHSSHCWFNQFLHTVPFFYAVILTINVNYQYSTVVRNAFILMVVAICLKTWLQHCGSVNGYFGYTILETLSPNQWYLSFTVCVIALFTINQSNRKMSSFVWNKKKGKIWWKRPQNIINHQHMLVNLLRHLNYEDSLYS